MDQPIYQVSQVNEYVKALLDGEPILQDILVRGELSNYKVYPSGHHYFTLKDRDSALRCVMILEKIDSPADVKALSRRDLDTLCGELRSFLIENISQTGGHLASNLGVVELTVAIHRVFDTANDRLVFDVGHQCYVHKALTGRKELFGTLRQFGGLSGFPKPYESGHDAFVAGHASNSVSVALGMDLNYMMGSLAGDDTAFLVMKDTASAETFCNEIQEMINA